MTIKFNNINRMDLSFTMSAVLIVNLQCAKLEDRRLNYLFICYLQVLVLINVKCVNNTFFD